MTPFTAIAITAVNCGASSLVETLHDDVASMYATNVVRRTSANQLRAACRATVTRQLGCRD